MAKMGAHLSADGIIDLRFLLAVHMMNHTTFHRYSFRQETLGYYISGFHISMREAYQEWDRHSSEPLDLLLI